MSKDIFRFKQFTVSHGQSSLKVTTDAVIFGAWINAQNPSSILDIGTGCGVLGLMMAQKYPEAKITAVEIDLASATEANQNFEKSDWAGRLEIVHTDFRHWETAHKFDCIISNPPYFINSLPSASKQKARAKHDGSLTYEDLLLGICKLVTDEGSAFLIIPFEHVELIAQIGEKYNLYVNESLEVSSFEAKEPYVILLSLSKQKNEYQTQTLVIRNNDLSYTNAYHKLTEGFYL